MSKLHIPAFVLVGIFLGILFALTACVNPTPRDGAGPTQAQLLYDTAVRHALSMPNGIF